MLILIILGVLIVIGIVMIVVAKITNCCCYSANDICYYNSGVLFVFGCLFVVVAGIILLICTVLITSIQINKDNEYRQKIYEKEMLEYRLEHLEDNLVGNEILYSEITDFNNMLMENKYYSGSLWVGLFWNDKIATIEFIEVGN